MNPRMGLFIAKVAAGLLCWLVVPAGVAGASPKGGESAPPYQVLDPDLSALRQRFNADADQIRILLLLSPT